MWRCGRRRGVAMAARSLLPLEDPDERADDLLPDGSSLPAFQRHLTAVLQVPFVVLQQPRRQLRVAHCEVDLVVVLEGTIVDVRRPEDAPELVDDQDLGVCHRWTVLMD